MAAPWHLIAGSTGAGKTTYARQLAEVVGGIVFSVDDWMNVLFWPDCPTKNDLPWAMARVLRCEDMAAATGAQLAGRGVPAILDMGLTSRSSRERWVERAAGVGAPVILHVLDPARELRWERVQARNAAATGTFAFEVTAAMFAMVETMWEPPGEAESRLYQEVVWP